jgi:hypothetical protein
MRNLLTWLMVLGVLAGVNLRGFPADGDHRTVCKEKMEQCCGSDLSSLSDSSHDHDDRECPPDHHDDHQCCLHGVPLSVDQHAESLLKDPASTFFGFRHEGEVPPDGPFLSSEKPPLI